MGSGRTEQRPCRMAVTHYERADRPAPRELENDVGRAIAVEICGAGDFPTRRRPADIAESHPLIRPQFGDIAARRIAQQNVAPSIAVEIAHSDYLVTIR